MRAIFSRKQKETPGLLHRAALKIGLFQGKRAHGPAQNSTLLHRLYGTPAKRAKLCALHSNDLRPLAKKGPVQNYLFPEEKRLLRHDRESKGAIRQPVPPNVILSVAKRREESFAGKEILRSPSLPQDGPTAVPSLALDSRPSTLDPRLTYGNIAAAAHTPPVSNSAPRALSGIGLHM